MRLAENQVIELEPEHEKQFPVWTEYNNSSIKVKCRTTIVEPSQPHITYWEIEYLDDTPNHSKGETRICSERFLLRYQTLNGEKPEFVVA